MFLLFACHTLDVPSEAAALQAAGQTEDTAEDSPQTEGGPDGSFPSLQSPLDGTLLEDEAIEFWVGSSSSVQLFVFHRDDLSNPLAISELLPSVDERVQWAWTGFEAWQSYSWYAENDTGVSVMWNFDTSGPNSAPTEPELLSPEQDAILTLSEWQFELSGGDDPDGDEIRYVIQILKEDQPITESPELMSEDLPWVPELNIEAVTPLCWTAWAIDDKEAQSPRAEPICFELHPD